MSILRALEAASKRRKWQSDDVASEALFALTLTALTLDGKEVEGRAEAGSVAEGGGIDGRRAQKWMHRGRLVGRRCHAEPERCCCWRAIAAVAAGELKCRSSHREHAARRDACSLFSWLPPDSRENQQAVAAACILLG